MNDDLRALARLRGWSEEVYSDFGALQSGQLTPDDFRAKYLVTRAILDLDITGFTESCIKQGQINSLLRIFDTQKIALPVFESNGAGLVRAFADDIVALFEDVDAALNAALEIHERIVQFNQTAKYECPPECCIGIGFGNVYAIGPNLAQGDEMNRASKLGEDIARGGETLLTENAAQALTHRSDIEMVQQSQDDLLFPFYRVERL